MRKTQQGIFGKRLMIWRKMRGGGRKVPYLPIWVDFEWYRSKPTGVGFVNLLVSDKYNHRNWAFSAYFYYKGV